MSSDGIFLQIQNSDAVRMVHRVYDLSPIKVASVERAYKDLRSCDVRRYGNVILVAHKHKIVLCEMIHIGVGRASEEYQKIYLVVRYTCAYLLGAALRSGHHLFDLESGSIRDILGSYSSGAERVLAEYPTVSYTKFSHEFLLRIVRYYCNLHAYRPFQN